MILTNVRHMATPIELLRKLKKITEKYPFTLFLRYCGGYIYCCPQYVHENIQYASFDTKIAKITHLEVEIFGIQDMKGTHNFGLKSC